MHPVVGVLRWEMRVVQGQGLGVGCALKFVAVLTKKSQRSGTRYIYYSIRFVSIRGVAVTLGLPMA